MIGFLSRSGEASSGSDKGQGRKRPLPVTLIAGHPGKSGNIAGWLSDIIGPVIEFRT
ncbi:hypothetical protein MWU54_09265 [Marivita sp. S6314]|nr:hypothetical protein [Marivita sp. S6314]